MDERDVEHIFRQYEIKEDKSPPVLKKIDEDPCSKIAREVASGWLNHCVKNHSSCRPCIELQKAPRRLIDVGNEGQNPSLVETYPDLQHVEWISLSYCWGEEEPKVKLDKYTMEDFKAGLPMKDFDDTIRDAILVTRALGISYIWIDALCIVQDQDGVEWKEEAPKMNEIYGGSTVTLVVGSSASINDGFLGKEGRKFNYIPVPRSNEIRDGHAAKLYISPEWDDSEREYNGPWSKRGWTMQEGLLPNRLLHYTSSQIVWKCCEEERFERGVTERLDDRASEVLSYSNLMFFESGVHDSLPLFLRFKSFKRCLPRSLNCPSMFQAETFCLWYDLVEDYTQRSFKNISDRLVAISGLAKMYGDMIRNPTYVAGLWKEDLLRGLLWHIEGAALIPKRSKESTSDHRFPSWTWLSVGYQAVKNDLKTESVLHPLSTIENIEFDPNVVRDPSGTINRGSLTITGSLKRMSRLYNTKWASADPSISKLERYISAIVEEESQEGVADKYISLPEGHFGVLQILEDSQSLHMLVLETTGKFRNGRDVYRRTGILNIRYIAPSSVASPEQLCMMKDLGLIKEDKKERKTLDLETSNATFMGLTSESWAEQTVVME